MILLTESKNQKLETIICFYLIANTMQKAEIETQRNATQEDNFPLISQIISSQNSFQVSEFFLIIQYVRKNIRFPSNQQMFAFSLPPPKLEKIPYASRGINFTWAWKQVFSSQKFFRWVAGVKKLKVETAHNIRKIGEILE